MRTPQSATTEKNFGRLQRITSGNINQQHSVRQYAHGCKADNQYCNQHETRFKCSQQHRQPALLKNARFPAVQFRQLNKRHAVARLRDGCYRAFIFALDIVQRYALRQQRLTIFSGRMHLILILTYPRVNFHKNIYLSAAPISFYFSLQNDVFESFSRARRPRSSA